MFYSTNILQKKGALGTIWIAAHHDVAKKLTKIQILNTDIAVSAGQIQDPEVEMALRLSSHLLVGLSKIYTRKVQFLFTDCNEALSKITLAFRPSNVDMAPVNARAQMRAITLDDPGVTDMDLDLELNLTDADWLTNDVGASQASVLDITMPDTQASQARASQAQWEEEDPLFFGGGIEAGGANPLDIDFGELDPEAPRDDEEDPELRRDSDGSMLQPIAAPEMPERASSAAGMEIDYEPEMLPEFDMDLPEAARASGAHPPSLPATPMRGSDADGLTSFATPEVEVKEKAAARRRVKKAVLDDRTELPKDVARDWVMNAESVKDLLREPRHLPKTRREAEARKLLEGGKSVADTMMRMPLSGYLGARLRNALRVSEDGESGEPRAAKKPRVSQNAPAEELELGGAGDDLGVGMADFDFDVEPPVMDQEDYQVQQPEEEQEGQGDASTARDLDVSVEGGAAGGADGGGIFSEYAADDGEEAAEGAEGGEVGGAREVEHQERTKKVIVMLQKSFKRRVTAAPLQFAAMIQPVEEDAPPPSKHTAAVAFFELLGLHAKGFVNLSQPVAFGDISIAPQDRLMKQKVKLAA